jgi:catechol 2,3-dioxygenase-like lactoylglutathione lyase family enzyme
MRPPFNPKEIRIMTTLNHLNLAVSNVPELASFFQAGFNFRVVEQRGLGKFALLFGENGFVLTLMHDKKVDASTYPAMFHVGFQVSSQQEVLRHHALLSEAGFFAPTPNLLDRGGPKTFGFYCNAPGGVMVEVSAPASET